MSCNHSSSVDNMYNFLHYRILLNLTLIERLFLAKMPRNVKMVMKKKRGNESMTRKELLHKTKLTPLKNASFLHHAQGNRALIYITYRYWKKKLRKIIIDLPKYFAKRMYALK